jgi:hypothetical protein
MANLQPIEERLDKLEVAFLMLLNSLRATKTLGEDTLIMEVPSSTLDILEKMIVTRINK